MGANAFSVDEWAWSEKEKGTEEGALFSVSLCALSVEDERRTKGKRA